MSTRPIAIDLFSGAGGLSLGFEQAGFDVRASVDVDPIHCAVHEFNFPGCVSIAGDAGALTGADIRARAGLGSAAIACVFGGPPCQGFSTMGRRSMEDPRNGLVMHFHRLVHELDPDTFAFENVKGLTAGSQRVFLDAFLDAFTASGRYDIVSPWQVLNAADFGVPQARKRLIIIGVRRGSTMPAWPVSAGRVTVADALDDIPDADTIPALIERDWAEVEHGQPSPYAAVLRGIIGDPGDFSVPRSWAPELLTSSLRTEHSELSKGRFAMTPHGTFEPVSRFYKLNPKGVSNTIRAGTGRDRGAYTSARPIHPHHPRCITVREAARLHSYPDWFRFHATKWHGFRQVGNSVPPLLGRAIAGSIAKAIGYSPVKPSHIHQLGDPRLLLLNGTQAEAHFASRR
ncbi:DNA cytosine methyltransferase [Bosea sp. RAC05]|uniref:DNA cytosine methyltransferase n=1 Tax=Bosea sp. RAC05 TaxID=1842539 RepID=UPI00083D6A21|nr:DNA cytosine methyltransferase [Bosea sp. RAC05]AOG02806.1 DNA (cytosine-5-)-methyltransferase family protein [Bosea sp. RAC05]